MFFLGQHAVQADNSVMLASVFVGAALAIVVCVTLIRTGQRNDAAPADNRSIPTSLKILSEGVLSN